MGSKEVAIKVKNVNKVFVLPNQKPNTLKSYILNPSLFFKKKQVEQQRALRNISFEVKKGEFFGIVGRNGSGKSTLLKCLAGVYTPESGDIKIHGKLVPFIELGVGFNPELSGRDNVYLNSSLLGFSRSETDQMYEEIVKFAELEEFMDQKLKNYSSGMQVRLAFSIAIRAKGDMLLLDEVLAVGDSLFQQKCFDYFNKLKKAGRTVMLVSHDANVLRQYCSRGILLEQGEMVTSGHIDDVLNDYIDILNEKEDKQSEKNSTQSKKTRHGTGKVLINKFYTHDEKNIIKKHFTDSDNDIYITGEYEAKRAVESPVYGVVVRDTLNNRIFSSNNIWLSKKSVDLEEGNTQKVTWRVPNTFNTGKYSISPAIADFSGKEVFDSYDEIITFSVRKKISSSALTNPKHEMIIEGVKND